ncbi:hypothetical protein [Colwellia psychrerythraea]|nr:hypothetical protein [Colwellia psychrerythraea]
MTVRIDEMGMDFVLISVHLKPGAGPSNRARRKHESESIYSWVGKNDNKEKDFIIIGDMNLYSCDVLTTMNIGEFKTLNSSCLNTNTNVNGPEPLTTHSIERDLQLKLI